MFILLVGLRMKLGVVQLLNNYPQKTFQKIAKTSGMNVEINSMGMARGDYDEDGDLDYYITKS